MLDTTPGVYEKERFC